MYTYSIIILKIARKVNRNVDFPGFSKSFIRLSANLHRKLRHFLYLTIDELLIEGTFLWKFTVNNRGSSHSKSFIRLSANPHRKLRHTISSKNAELSSVFKAFGTLYCAQFFYSCTFYWKSTSNPPGQYQKRRRLDTFTNLQGSQT